MLHTDTVKEGTAECTNDQFLQDVMTSYGQQIQQLAYTYVKDRSLAEDLTQEIFLKVYRKRHTFRQDSSIKTWVYRIAVNHCKDYVTSWHYRHVSVDDVSVTQARNSDPGLEQTVIKRSEEERLVQAVLDLPVKYREPVYLHYYEELSTPEISRLTEKNENTIKTRLNRARKLIKKRLDKEAAQ